MSFKVTIEQTEQSVVIKSPGYECLREEYLNTEEEYSSLSFQSKADWKRNEDGTYTHKIFGYAPKTEVVEKVVTKVYEQVVEVLDVSAVVAVINNTPARYIYDPANPDVPPLRMG